MQTYEQIEWEIVRFETNDVILTSSGKPGSGNIELPLF